jgi:hypothetical protein
MLFRILPLFLGLLLALPLSSAFAEEKTGDVAAPVEEAQRPVETAPKTEAPAAHPKINPPTRVLPSKIKPVREAPDEMAKAAPATQIETEETPDPESLFLYSTQAQGALALDFFTGVSRTEIGATLSSLSSLPYPSLRNLLLRAAGSDLDVSKFKADPAPAKDAENAGPPPPDVFSLRLATLIKLGAFEEALTLYKKNEGAPPSSNAALRGVQAMVGTGQLALACLEDKALEESLKNENSDFWNDLDVFCKSLLSPVAESEDDATRLASASRIFLSASSKTEPKNWSDLNGMSFFRVIALQQGGALNALPLTISDVSTLSPEILALLASQPLTTPTQSLPLLANAAKRGILSKDALAERYSLFASANTPPYSGPWGNFLTLYLKQSVTGGPDLIGLLTASDSAGLGSLLPIAGNYELADPSAFTDSQARKVLKLLILADSQAISPWVSRVYGEEKPAETEKAQQDQIDEDQDGASNLIRVWLKDLPEIPATKTGKSPQKGAKNEKDPASSPEVKENLNSDEMALALALQPFLAKTPLKSTKNKIYDNILSLTAKSNYVMPSGELMDSLQKAAAARQTGRVVLDSVQILNGLRPDEVHPAALFKILDAYESVGLSEETSSLALDALLGLTGEKKEK